MPWPFYLLWISLALYPFALYAQRKAQQEVEMSEHARVLRGLKLIEQDGATVHVLQRQG